jgi:hypothetical protein
MAAIARPIATSGHPEPVYDTPAAATSTPTLPITSFREHNHADCMLTSSDRRRQSRARHARLAARAARPIPPMTSAVGTPPRTALPSASARTPTANPAITTPLSSDARAFHTRLRLTT